MTERLLHQESKLKEKVSAQSEDSQGALIVNPRKNPRKQFTCHYCHKPGKTVGSTLQLSRNKEPIWSQ